MNKKNLFITLLVGLLVVLAFSLFPSNDKSVLAQATGSDGEMRGFAWSSNIGWVSFNSKDLPNSTVDYSVRINTDKSLEGYAWSPNLGWLRFGSDLTGPTGKGDNWGAKLVGNRLAGWARFCSIYVSGCSGATKDIGGTELGGWDGWLKMSDVNYDTATGGFSGFAWGSLNVGWLKLGLHTEVPTVCPVDLVGDCCPAWQACGGGGGGGPSVICKVTPSTGNIGQQFTWYVESLVGFSGNPSDFTYVWTGDNMSGAGTWNSSLNRNENKVIYSSAGSKTASVRVTDAFGNTATDLCSNTNGTDGIEVVACSSVGQAPSATSPCCSPLVADVDGLCAMPPSSCRLTLMGDLKQVKYYRDQSANKYVPKVKVAIAGNCGDGGADLVADGLNYNFNLICSTNGLSWSPCNNLEPGELFVWVEPKTFLPNDPIRNNRFSLKLNDPSLVLRFDYIISGAI